MRNIYLAIADAARRFFVATGIPVPRLARRVHRVLHRTLADDKRDLREEVAALARAVDRLETMVYIDRIGRRPD
jgi:hypothetical protein